MNAQRLDEIAQRYGYTLRYISKRGTRIYSNALNAVSLSVDELAHLEQREGSESLRDYLERVFI